MAVPGEPVMDEATRKQVMDLTAKGFAGTVFLTTEDCQASYEEMKSRGVEFTEQPNQMPYGIDCGFRDPSGNSVRLTQLAENSPILDRCEPPPPRSARPPSSWRRRARS